MLLLIVVLLVVSYMIGSIPFGYLLAMGLRGVDIRQEGSRNIGATNVGRVIGWKWFGVTLALDFAKGFLPCLAVPAIVQAIYGPTTDWLHPQNLMVAAGVVAFFGHLYPCWLGFCGGKGVATSLGVIVALAPGSSWWPVGAALGLFILCVLVTRYVSLGSLVGALSYGILQLVLSPAPFSASAAGTTAFAIAAPLLVLWKHRQNMVRLWRGEESKVGERKAKPAGS